MDSPDYCSGWQSRNQNTYRGNFTRLLRLGGRTKRKDNGAKRKIRNFVSHVSAPTY